MICILRNVISLAYNGLPASRNVHLVSGKHEIGREELLNILGGRIEFKIPFSAKRNKIRIVRAVVGKSLFLIIVGNKISSRLLAVHVKHVKRSVVSKIKHKKLLKNYTYCLYYTSILRKFQRYYVIILLKSTAGAKKENHPYGWLLTTFRGERFADLRYVFEFLLTKRRICGIIILQRSVFSGRN